MQHVDIWCYGLCPIWHRNLSPRLFGALVPAALHGLCELAIFLRQLLKNCNTLQANTGHRSASSAAQCTSPWVAHRVFHPSRDSPPFSVDSSRPYRVHLFSVLCGPAHCKGQQTASSHDNRATGLPLLTVFPTSPCRRALKHRRPRPFITPVIHKAACDPGRVVITIIVPIRAYYSLSYSCSHAIRARSHLWSDSYIFHPVRVHACTD